eukprot:3603423-Pyramimonas_sp.AAC.1
MWALGGPATTTTAPARYFLTIYPETPWPERPPKSGTAAAAASAELDYSLAASRGVLARAFCA